VVEAGPIRIELVGGPMDGDSQVWTANGSIAPPASIGYLSSHDGEPVWETYEAKLGNMKWEHHRRCSSTTPADGRC